MLLNLIPLIHVSDGLLTKLQVKQAMPMTAISPDSLFICMYVFFNGERYKRTKDRAC